VKPGAESAGEVRLKVTIGTTTYQAVCEVEPGEACADPAVVAVVDKVFEFARKQLTF
jgi:hypothetical protein